MPSFYQARPGGVIQVIEEKTASEIVTDLNKRAESGEYVEPEEKFINDYIQQNSKRIQVRDFFFSKNIEKIGFSIFRAHHQH